MQSMDARLTCAATIFTNRLERHYPAATRALLDGIVHGIESWKDQREHLSSRLGALYQIQNLPTSLITPALRTALFQATQDPVPMVRSAAWIALNRHASRPS